MRVPVGDLEAAMRQKRQSAGESSRPSKKLRLRGPTGPPAAPAPPAPRGERAERRPTREVAPRPSRAVVEEGEITATTGAAVLVLDDEDIPAAANVPGAGQVTVAVAPPAATETERRSTPPAAGAGESTATVDQRGPPEAPQAPRSRTEDPPTLAAVRETLAAVRQFRDIEDIRQRRHRPVSPIKAASDAVEAYTLLKGIRTAEIAEEMGSMSHADLLDTAVVSIIQMGNAAIGLRESFALTSERLGSCIRKTKELKEENEAQAERLARLQGEAVAREEGSSNRLKELEGQVEAAAKRAADAEGKVATAESAAAAEVRAARERAAAAVEKAVAAAREMTAAQERAAAAEKAAAEAAAEKAGAVACADEATARAGEAEERAREAEGKVRDLESKIRAAEDEARRAVADYKASDEFKQEVIEGSLDAYVQGFEICKVKVSAALKIDIVALDGVQPGGSDEESAEDQQEAEPAPGES